MIHASDLRHGVTNTDTNTTSHYGHDRFVITRHVVLPGVDLGCVVLEFSVPVVVEMIETV